jgi:hypothetical protein
MDFAYIDPDDAKIKFIEAKGGPTSSKTSGQLISHPLLDKGANWEIKGLKGKNIGLGPGTVGSGFTIFHAENIQDFNTRFAHIQRVDKVPYHNIDSSGKLRETKWLSQDEARKLIPSSSKPVREIGETAGKNLGKTAGKNLAEVGTKSIGKRVLRSGLKMVPIIGILPGSASAAENVVEENYVRAGLDVAGMFIDPIDWAMFSFDLGVAYYEFSKEFLKSYIQYMSYKIDGARPYGPRLIPTGAW